MSQIRQHISCRGLIALLLINLLWLPSSAHASKELRAALTEMASNLKKLLDGQSEESIAIGQFTGPANLPTSAGPGIVQMLSEELQKKGITVKKRAKFGLKGEYKLAETPASDEFEAKRGRKVLALKIRAIVEDVFGNPLTDFTFNRLIAGEATVLTSLGLPAHLPPDGSQVERDKKVRERLFDPKTHIKGTVIRSDPKSLYGIEILINGKTRNVKDDEGLAFVSIDRGETYAVRLINDSPHEAGVQLKIDGISMFAFSKVRHTTGTKKGEPKYTTIIVPAKKSVIIKGWHISNSITDKFLVTAYAKSAAALLKSTTKTGVITASFQAAWKVDENPPRDEPGKGRGPGTGDATGRGPSIPDPTREVKRNLGIIRDSVSVRYTKSK